MKYLGVDWGLKRVGLALSLGSLASCHSTIKIKSLADGVEKITNIYQKEKIDLLVMGKPEGEMGKKVDKAAKYLQKAGLKVVLADETLSTKHAQAKMIEMGFSKEKRKDDNSVAAALILQEYLDEI